MRPFSVLLSSVLMIFLNASISAHAADWGTLRDTGQELDVTIGNAIDSQLTSDEVTALEADNDEPKKKKRARAQYRAYKKANPESANDVATIKNFHAAIAKDPKLQERLKTILEHCAIDSELCLNEMNALYVEVTGQSMPSNEPNLPGRLASMKGTFGICSFTKEGSQPIHWGVYSKRVYNCDLSTEGKVWKKTVTRKSYGPGLYWGKQSILIACSGSAFGTKNIGLSAGAGAYYGLTLGMSAGGAGACVYLGMGQSAGAYFGVDALAYEAL